MVELTGETCGGAAAAGGAGVSTSLPVASAGMKDFLWKGRDS